MNKNQYPRELAVFALTRVLSTGDHLEVAIDAALAKAGSDAPRAWLQEVCSGTLRWKGRLDLAIDALAQKKKPTGALRKYLLLGAYQLIGQERTDPTSVVFETVDAIKRIEGEAPAKFANAVLRRLAEHAQEWRESPFPKTAAFLEKCAWASLPPWIWKSWVKAYGEESAAQLARAQLDRPEIWLQSDGIAADVEQGLEAGPSTSALKWTPGKRALTALSGWSEGKLFVQDLSSQMLVREVFEALPESAQKGRVLDLCAAPGGKSVALAWAGMDVVATDRSEDMRADRMRLLAENAQRLGRGKIMTVPRNEIPSADFTLVWVDAPCTGSGVLRRHPEIRWLRSEKDLQTLIESQRSILAEARKWVKPGQFLVYSVCSLMAEEGRAQIEARPDDWKDFEIQKSWLLRPDESPFPDGFYAVLLKRRS